MQTSIVYIAIALLMGALMAVYLPVLASVMGLTHPGVSGWLLVLACSALTYVVGQTAKMLTRVLPARVANKGL